jgi:hypothetical protein
VSVIELQKRIAKLKPAQRRSLAEYVDQMLVPPAPKPPFDAKAMRSVLGCARNFQPGKSSRRILTELRGYDRATL